MLRRYLVVRPRWAVRTCVGTVRGFGGFLRTDGNQRFLFEPARELLEGLLLEELAGRTVSCFCRRREGNGMTYVSSKDDGTGLSPLMVGDNWRGSRRSEIN